ncbi:serine hydrolase [Rhodococcus pyridinivorans]|uniref:serine hydrolase n=1 Tax=Rhodococcus pyridinivorans TaxID=103816 RepID=UPI0022851844|nr:serine hydrolase [Rhodococcus pyridinivorans]WAL47194.1 serine hydrolase [Rhodococcus pyridinivorans]
MPNRIGTTLAATSVVIALAGCGQTGPSEPDVAAPSGAGTSAPTGECAPTPAADVTTAEGWIGYLAENFDTVAIAVDDGNGGTFEQRPDERQPLASAVKVVHLAAYARAVAAGELSPDERVPLADWERWHLPDTDGGAHPRALERLGVNDPEDTVTLDEMVSAMIQESDNAVPDYLRDRLGDDALREAAAQGGWDDFTPPTMLGNTLALLDPTLDDSSAVWDAARRYASDPAYRVEAVQRPLPEDLFARVDRVQRFDNTGSAAELSALHRAIADGSFGAGSDLARTHLEWQPSTVPGFEGVGFKGGSLPGILTDAVTFRRDDGTIATTVMLASGMSDSDYVGALESFAHQEMLAAAANDPDFLERIRCAM